MPDDWAVCSLAALRPFASLPMSVAPPRWATRLALGTTRCRDLRECYARSRPGSGFKTHYERHREDMSDTANL
jgi:hypothetical protein